MKPHYFIPALILLPFVGIGQSSTLLTGKNVKPVVGDRLEQYLWGYAKNGSGNNEKSLIDFTAIDNWSRLGRYLSVSDDGKFFAYTIFKPTGTRYWYPRLDSLVVLATHGGWRTAFAGAQPGVFTANGKQYIFKNGESLCFLPLGKTNPRYIKNVVSYKVFQHGRNEWLACLLKSTDSNFILHNLATQKEIYFSGITEYSFDNSGAWLACKTNANDLLLYNLATGAQQRIPFITAYTFATNGKALLLKTTEKTDHGTTTALKYLGLPDGKEKTIWSSNKEKTDIGGYSIDNSGLQVVFSVQDGTGASIWYYEAGANKAMAKVTNATPGIEKGLTITKSVSFTDNGHYIKFSLQPVVMSVKPDAEIAQVEVWDHKALYLPPAQAALSAQPKAYNAFMNIATGQVLPLESNGKKVYLLNNDFAVVKADAVEEHGDRFWEVGKAATDDSTWLVSLKDGSSHFLPVKASRSFFWFSPDGRFLVYFDPAKGCHYFSYDLQTGELKNISANIPDNQLGYVNRYRGNLPDYSNLAAWVADGAGVLVYDNNDIWRLDLTGKAPAVNITNGFGRSNNMMLYLLTTDHYSRDLPVLQSNAPLVLRAFNYQTKQNGFYRKPNLNAGDPNLLYLGGYFMNLVTGCQDLNLSNEGWAPVKAENRDYWIVQRQSNTDAPNYYETTNFKAFRRLTNYQPQQKYRWMKEELHAFTHLDGTAGQGILYKPEDFDPTKKYPVLITFYGAFSDDLYQFHIPTYINQAMAPGMSPIWFINNGYLVFTPDIHTTPHKYGQSAFNVIEGAAQYLKQLPYVDAGKLGCASHSWSAKLGTYVFTHSASFNATAISEGFLYADPINMALSPSNGVSRLKDVELQQEYGPLWENKEAWLEQTAVLHADKAKSPLLLFCNQESSKDYQDQTFQLFNALRRLDKDVWWLKYENGDHTLSDQKELRDYTIRYTQFFDHYLKEAPAPLWMTNGIPITLKGVENRYELDPAGSCGKDCEICKKWNAQYKAHPDMFKQPITQWHL